jgi:hypothetical protein
MNHRKPKIMMVHSDEIYLVVHNVVHWMYSWDDALRVRQMSFLDLVDDYNASKLVSGYTPVITRLCQELSSPLWGRKASEEMESLLDQFRFTRSLIEGLSSMRTGV